MDIYVVHAYRWGDRENHSYLVGVWFDEGSALFYANEHQIHRGGKYICEIVKCKPHTYRYDLAIQEQEIVKSLEE